MARTNVKMNGEAVAVVAHANSATSKRLLHRAAAGLNVSRSSVDVSRVDSSTDTTVVRRRSIAADDPERRSTGDPPDALEDVDQALVWHALRKQTGAVLGELPPAEVWRQVAHELVYRIRRRCEPTTGLHFPDRMSDTVGTAGGITGALPTK